MTASPVTRQVETASASQSSVVTAPEQEGRSGLTLLEIPESAAAQDNQRQPATEAQVAALVGDELVDAALSPQTIPQFASTVLGGVLGVPFVISPDVAMRTEVVSGGSGGSVTRRDLFRLTQLALRQYGVEMYIDGGLVTVGSPGPSGSGTTVVRDRSSPENGGRVVQFFPVQTIEVNVLQSLLQDLFPNLGNARITPDQLSNSLIISGPGREVAQVVRTLREIDQPRFAGAEVLRVQPVFWSTDNLASSLEQVLTTEGYVISRQAVAGRAIVILSFPAANQLLIFTKDPALLERARYWVDTLDQPAALGDKTSTFVYQVQNTDAQSLGQLAIGQAPSANEARAPVGVPGAPPATDGAASGAAQSAVGAGGTFLGGRLLTDPVGNRIIFTGTATDFAQLRDLMQVLDVPAPQVVIEVMLAEVTLTDSTSLGINFSGTEPEGDGTITFGTEGIAVGSGGFLGTFVGPDFRARLNAEASNNRVNILQRPRLVVRSGQSARFQVGTDVPIITSQRATDTSQNGNGTDILQSVQYRQTGVILDLEPIVYGDRVDIRISQENSAAGAPPAGIASPTILNRSLTTQIQIRDGETGVLGGLISNNYTKDNSGVPFLKDLPIVGSAFQTNSVDGERTELLILITPYILRGDDDMASFVDMYSRDMNAAFRTGRGWSYTLTPFSLGSRFPGVGFDLPRPDGVSAAPARSVPAAPPDEEESAAPEA
jgi:general secretion pathway protein D